MLVLSADTSLPVLSVALTNDDALVGAIAFEGRGSRNEKLLPAIDWMLAENGVDRRQLDLLAVTRGPGSFTGVRIGLATMQGLALAIERPLCAMSTHEAAAWGESGSLVVWDDAGRGELYLSQFQDGEPLSVPRLATTAERDAAEAGGARLLAIPSLVQSGNLALRCARRALAILRGNRAEQYRDVTPIYVRLAEAEVKLQQRRDA